MAIMFSKVTMRDDYNESEFLVGGFPQEADDLEGWTAYHEFLDEITEDTVVWKMYLSCVTQLIIIDIKRHARLLYVAVRV